MSIVNFKKSIGNLVLLLGLWFALVGCSNDDNSVSPQAKEPARPRKLISDNANGRFSEYDIGYDNHGRITSIFMFIGKRIEDSLFNEVITESNIIFIYDTSGKLTTISMVQEEGLQVRFDWKYNPQSQLTGMEVNWPDASTTYIFEHDPNTQRLTFSSESPSSAFPFWVDFDNEKLTEASFAGNSASFTYNQYRGSFADIDILPAMTLFSLYLYTIYDSMFPLQLFQPLAIETSSFGPRFHKADGFEFDSENRITAYSLLQELPEGEGNHYHFTITYLEKPKSDEETR